MDVYIDYADRCRPDNAVICPHHKLATVEFATQTTHWDGKLLKIKGSLH